MPLFLKICATLILLGLAMGFFSLVAPPGELKRYLDKGGLAVLVSTMFFAALYLIWGLV